MFLRRGEERNVCVDVCVCVLHRHLYVCVCLCCEGGDDGVCVGVVMGFEVLACTSNEL